MFNAQSLLGSLLKEVTGGRGLGSKASLGMGAIGIAIAAYDHFTQEGGAAQGSSATTGSKPPPPPTSRSGPPPVPGSSGKPPPPPAMMEANNVEALLLIDAMVAAANADGHIDEEEANKILTKIQAVGCDQEGIDYLRRKMDTPPSLQQICSGSIDQERAKQIYLVSLLTISVDTEQEVQYLQNLAFGLNLDDPTVAEITSQIQA